MALKGNVPSNSQTTSSASPRVEWAPIESLRPNPKNARTHSKKQIRQIARSIRQFGFLNPAIVDDANTILAGHGRFEAARLEGLTHVPILRFNHLTEAEKRAYAIADNRLAEQAGWDRQLLSIELGELIDLLPIEGLDISLTGFEIPEIDLLIASRAKSRSTPEDVVPQPPLHAVTRPGDLWLLGDHRLLCGDARSAVDFGRLMEGSLAAAVFCTSAKHACRIGDPARRDRAPRIRIRIPPRCRLSNIANSSWRRSAMPRVFRLKAQFISSASDWRRINDLIEVGRTLYGEMLNLVVWDKSSAGPGSPYRSQHEPIGVFQVGRQPHQNNAELRRFGRQSVGRLDLSGPGDGGQKPGRGARCRSHSKPLALVADALLDCTAKGEIVLDPFAGSGATILAAEKVARMAYALETRGALRRRRHPAMATDDQT